LLQPGDQLGLGRPADPAARFFENAVRWEAYRFP
jgi:hypothetical protein